MTSSSGGTITINGKTYNISQINSVYTGTVKRHNGVWGLFLVCGIPGFFLAAIHPAVWFVATLAAFIAAVRFSDLRDYAVFFDMSSGKVSAYTNSDKDTVEAMRLDIVKGMEQGSYSN